MLKLQESVKILYTLWIYITTYMGGCLEVNSEKKFQKHKLRFFPDVTLDSVIIVSMVNQILIMICSFIDEWNDHFTPSNIPEFKDEIIRFKTVMKPVFKRINRWSNLKDYRNTVLAHNFRNKGESILREEVKAMKTPLRPDEIFEITVLLNIVVLELMQKFSNYIALEDYVDMFAKVPKFSSVVGADKKEVELIIKEVNDLISVHYQQKESI
ncbi:hypothetical protein GO730_05760 [Spirosoma sp. HMF3257]|uniref:HEPN AbiU2-like domain-containing protein n=1 Tax=Spirosoma telluris TaxID=2183553 RepID=A0A327NFH7_9BACT|nr:hypothetical protein [Spirosoma telluris]RAI73982.1 hypothetical protein HMF3257_05720 [Spirosoma telluris]